jgi:hypothetical protein
MICSPEIAKPNESSLILGDGKNDISLFICGLCQILVACYMLSWDIHRLDALITNAPREFELQASCGLNSFRSQRDFVGPLP